MVDDWLLAGVTLPDIMKRCARLAVMFKFLGLFMLPNKNVYGTIVKYLGVVFNTLKMRMRIDKNTSAWHEATTAGRLGRNQEPEAGGTQHPLPPRWTVKLVFQSSAE